MPIDTSIYNNIKQFEAPSVADAQAKAMSLSQLSMQNQRMSDQMKSDGENQKIEQAKKIQAMALPQMEYLAGLPEQKRAQAYPSIMKDLASKGTPMENVPHDAEGNAIYDPQHFSASYGALKNSDLYLKNALTKSEINKNNAAARQKSGEYDPYKQMQMEKLAQEIEDKKFSKTPEGRLQKLGGEQKQRLDNAKLGLISSQGMADALAKGDNTFSIIGDNDFTQQRALFEEALGRMQSGGAISKGEEDRFKKMAPTMTDSAEMQQKKLAQLQEEMKSRIGTLGFSPEDVGIAARSKEQKKSSGDITGLGMNQANANEIPLAPKGKVLMQSPNGKMVYVNESEKGEAIAAGGKVVK